MNREKAWRKIRRKLARAKPCPFCGKIPEFSVYCDSDYSERGSWGHYATRKGCCRVTALGQTELFFTNDWKVPDYRLWFRMANGLVDEWNRRIVNNE